jgi:hypothetical protein
LKTGWRTDGLRGELTYDRRAGGVWVGIYAL